MVLPSSRAERERLARELRSCGMRLREIAAELGVAISTVDSWLNDPGGERLRRRKNGYRGRCERCGGTTDGSSGPGRAPRICAVCFRSQPHSLERARRLGAGAPPRYSDEDLLGALLEAERIGLSTSPSYSAAAAAAGLPSLATVIKRFGSWNAARRRAGLPTRRSPRPDYGRTSVEQCVEAIVEVWRRIGEPPTVQRYEAARGPRDPCAATIRARCGRWSGALELASRTLAQDGEFVQDDAGGLAPSAGARATDRLALAA